MTHPDESELERAEREHVAKGGSPGWSRVAMEESAAQRIEERTPKTRTSIA